MAEGDLFGQTPQGRPVTKYRLEAGGLSASILDLGAIVQDLRLKGHAAPLVLGFENVASYFDHSLFFGAMVGRHANRIRNGRFTIDGEQFQVDPGRTDHALHGGSFGLHERLWTVEEAGKDHITLALHDPHRVDGFPGDLDITCTYRLKPPATLSVELEARCDRPTLCNLAHHSYFNLDDGGAGDVLDHRMMIAASAYLPVDDELVPTGHVVPVEGTPFDFVLPRPIRLEWEAETMDYDHNFCLSSQRGPMRQAAWLQGGRAGVEMEVWTTEPGLQFFDGNFPPREVPGLGGRIYGARAGLCLEPQIWPDSPNNPHFPQAVLRPGETYRQVTEYRFQLPSETTGD
ncbi:galactose-1-epimerase [Chelativorans sp. ZYF759]|uniref:aldose epimerase family protein n=1 Tax=Chelativorans sp. ZYF759 TaxID=2692213 RepID=UPI00145CABB3|nr:galactose-1-epimerase [Chelativorans sp. ZYF759]